MFSDTLGRDTDVDYLCHQASERLYFLTLLRHAGVSPGDIVNIFTSLIRSVLEYTGKVWYPGLTQEQSDVLEHIQKRALHTAYPHLDYERALSAAGLCRLCERRENACRVFFKSMLVPSHTLPHLVYWKDKHCRVISENQIHTPCLTCHPNVSNALRSPMVFLTSKLRPRLFSSPKL